MESWENTIPPKEHIKLSGTYSKEVDSQESSDKELKIIVLKKLNEIQDENNLTKSGKQNTKK
jgi:hypothetical protein